MKIELDDFHRDIPDSELIDDLKKISRETEEQRRTLTFRSYNEMGKYSSATLATRFGSWNKALVNAGIQPVVEKNITHESLFENLRNVWLHKGAQPVFRDMALPPSQYSASVYSDRFGSWRKSLEAFVEFVHSDDWIRIDTSDTKKSVGDIAADKTTRRRTNRNISERMRFRILLNDGFACQACGASPLKDRGVELHVDHIIPWSKGGETEDANLQTKCARCNLGKGNAFNK